MNGSLYRAVLVHKKTGAIKIKHYSGKDLSEAYFNSTKFLSAHQCVSLTMTNFSYGKLLTKIKGVREEEFDEH